MKRFLSLVLSLLFVLSVAGSFAEDLGVVVIRKPGSQSSLEDMEIGTTYTIDRFVKITPCEFLAIDCYATFKKDANYYYTKSWYGDLDQSVFVKEGTYWPWDVAGWVDSGTQADYVWLRVDVLNLTKEQVKYIEQAEVTVIYQDEYEFQGQVRQINYDYLNYPDLNVCRAGDSVYPNAVVLDPSNEEAIGMLYTGTYAFIATLPNIVIKDQSSPLRMVIKLDGHQMIYNIRK